MTAAYLKGPEIINLAKRKQQPFSCQGKIAFASYAIALRAAKRRKNRSHYQCTFCGQWHVGSNPTIKTGMQRSRDEAAKLIRKEEKHEQ
jgi:hypothetical protein